jgi:hypothetical protein
MKKVIKIKLSYLKKADALPVFFMIMIILLPGFLHAQTNWNIPKVWHYAPQVIVANKNPGGTHSFVVFAFILGLCFSYVAFRQQAFFRGSILF